MSKERPIIMQPAMANATAKGIKTATRRMAGLEGINENPEDWHLVNKVSEWEKEDSKGRKWFILDNKKGMVRHIPCPFGKAGDILYVRENWKLVGWDFENENDASFIYSNGDQETVPMPDPDEDNESFVKAMNWVLAQIEKLENNDIIKRHKNLESYNFTKKKHPFSPSIHLPRWASRLELRIKNISLQRLNSITKKQAIAEGITREVTGDDLYENYSKVGYRWISAVDSFCSLWISIHGKKSWDHNPWVWVIEFKKI